MNSNSLSLKPVVPITIAFPETLQIEIASKDASGLEKSIRTSKLSN